MSRIETVAKLPFMSDSMLNRIYGDKVEKLTMGFEVEVAVDPDDLRELASEDDDSEFDIDAARQTFQNRYQHMEFGKWASFQILNEDAASKFVHKYGIEPKYGWAGKATLESTAEFLSRVNRAGVLEKGPAFRDMMHALDDLFNPVFYAQLPFELVGPGKVPMINGPVHFKDSAPPVLFEIVDMLSWGVISIVDQKNAEYRKTADQILAGANLYMGPTVDKVRDNMLRKLGHITVNNGDGREHMKAAWAYAAVQIMTLYSKWAAGLKTATSRLTIWTDAEHTTTDTLKSIFSKLYEADDALSLDVFDAVDTDFMQSEFEDARDEKERLDEEQFIDEAQDQWARDREAMPGTDGKTAAIEFVKERFQIHFIDEDLERGRQGTQIVEDGSIEPFGAEIIAPPMAPNLALDWLGSKFEFIEETDGLSTNETTGLHCGIGTWEGHYRPSDPKNTIDVLKLLLFLGDPYLLSTFGRESNKYALPMMEDLQKAVRDESLSRDTAKLNKTIYKINSTLLYNADKYRTVNLDKLYAGYLEFRIMGGANYHRRFPDVKRTVMRFAQICVVASSPDLYRKEYLNQLYRLLSHSNRHTTDVAQEKQFAALFKAFAAKNASTFFGSRLKPRATAWELWTVTELPEKLFEFLNTPYLKLTPNYRDTRERVFAWIMDVLSKTGYSLGMREKLVSYVLFRLDRTAQPGNYDSDQMINGNSMTLWPWLMHIKRVI